jgi:catechol 2,3-dioxygenase-like lactoylglutathione lyase family enzyme
MTAATPLVTGTDFICVPVKDFEESRRFYAEVLGLEPSSVWQGRGQDPVGAEFETGSLTIAILNSEALGTDPTPHGSPIALHVDDVAAARAELESRGVEFKGDIIDSGVCHQTFFEDPAGNALGLHHRYAPRS